MGASSWTLSRRAVLLAALASFLSTCVPAHAAKPHPAAVNWKPAINLMGDLLLPDGQTPATIWTPQGPSPWNINADRVMPIPQGDKLRLNLFVATGGATLREVKVRLDNVVIADLTSTPWNTVIDTAKLTPGTHLLDVWAQATGNPPQDSSLEKGFVVLGPVPPSPTFPPPTVSLGPPAPPVVVPGAAADPGARVALFYNNNGGQGADTPITVANDTVAVTRPTQIKVRLVAAAGNDAAYYVYAITSDGVTVQEAPEQYQLLSATNATDTTIQIQAQTQDPAGVQAASQNVHTAPQGLPAGQYQLWVWPVNVAGHPGSPSEVTLQIP